MWTSITRLRELLARRPIDLDAVELAAADIGAAAVYPLLEALATAPERSVRSRLMEVLVEFGPGLVPVFLTHLDRADWPLQRNLLYLLARYPEQVPAERLLPFGRHDNVKVRREALRALVGRPDTRDRAIAMALTARDPLADRLGVLAAADRCPRSVAMLFIDRIRNGTLEKDLRPLAIRAVAPIMDVAVLELLLAIAGREWPVLGVRVAPRSPEVLAALTGLARYWFWHRRADRIVVRAWHHRHPAVRNAVRPYCGPPELNPPAPLPKPLLAPLDRATNV